LTEREKAERKFKRNILKLAKEHEDARDITKIQRYTMPEERRGKDQDFQYEETDERERVPNSEQKKWEDEQMGFAQYKFGAKDAKSKATDKEYDIILDEQIEFIQALKLPGNQKEKEKELTEVQKKRMTIDECKKSLPIFPFKQSLIDAVRNHQVLIIEGETGSGKTTQIPQYLKDAGFCDGNLFIIFI
jgi:pre-mRNA-splicing factor ATP-dependent RNA helicase DHX16